MNFSYQNIFLTGGTGSFGSAFIKHLIENKITPKRLIVYSRDWIKQKELRESLKNPEWIEWIIGDVRDYNRIERIMNNINLNAVIHTAAIKCVETCENNPTECLETNVIGTQNIMNSCIHRKVRKAILISTDKAVQPTNTYGTSKKMAEKLWIASGGNVVRYGNIVGSSGSVIPIYKKLISEGATSLPVTDERCTRFWYPMKKAIELVLASLKNYSSGELFIPQMPSVKIIDVCKAFNMPYHIIGLRPFEKIHEYMIAPDDVNNYPGCSSGNNDYFLTVEEIRRSINRIHGEENIDVANYN